MRITSQNLDETIQTNRKIKKEVRDRIQFMERYLKKIRIHSPEKQALQILKEHNLIQIPIPDRDWGGAIYELPNGHKIPVINTAQPRLYQYFIYWHEIYHLTEESATDITHNISTELDLADRKADYFASQMLISNDLYDYYHQLKYEDFIDRIASCMDTFKAPFKAILIELYELALEFSNLSLQNEIKKHFDLQLSPDAWENIFKGLSLDESLVKPTYIVDFGTLKGLIQEKSERHPDVELYNENKEFVLNLEAKFSRIKEAWENGQLS